MNPGLPLHDVVAYVAAGIGLLACTGSAVAGYRLARKLREIRGMYQNLVEYVAECYKVPHTHDDSKPRLPV